MCATTALDLFAGVGWGLAARALGIEEEGVEKMPQAVATRDALGLKTVHDDAWTCDYTPYSDAGLIASPPCQSFSMAGKGAGRKALDDVLQAIYDERFRSITELRGLADQVGDERTALVLMPMHAWWVMEPEWVVFEQVPTVQPVWDVCAAVMRTYGYNVWTGRLQAEQYGVPQTRKRSILIASRVRQVGPPTPTHSRYYPRNPSQLDAGVHKWVSMAEGLGWGSEFRMVSNYGTGGDPAARGERTGSEPAPTVTSKIDRNVIYGQARNSGPGASRDPRPVDEPSYTIRAQGSGSHPSGTEWVYNRPSTTIVGTFKPEIVAAPGYRTTVSRQNAPGSVRVTVQEAGLLQSFPEDTPWQGPQGKQFLQVGNAVPPGLGIPVLGEATGLPWQEVNAAYLSSLRTGQSSVVDPGVVYVNGNQAKAARRHLDQPAPTIHFGARSNKVEWQIESQE